MDKINHPKHYSANGKKECIEQMRDDFGDYITAIFCLTNANKYLYRAGNKEGESKDDDIAKAKWYYNYCIKKLKWVSQNNNDSRLLYSTFWRLKDYD